MATTDLRASIGLDSGTLAADFKKEVAAGAQAIKADLKKLSNDLSGTFDGGKKAASDYADQLKKAAAQMILDGKKGSTAFVSQQAELKKAAAEAKKYEKALQEVEEGLDGAAKKGGGLATSLVNAASAGVVFQGIGDAVSSFAEKGVEARNAVRELTAQTGATGEELKNLRALADDAFRAGVGENVAEATKAIGTAKQLLGGFLDDAGLADITVAAGGIAKAFDKDVNEVLGKSRTLVANFGLSGKEAGDLIALTMQEGGTAMDDVLDTMDEYSQLAKQAGFSAEEFSGLLIEGAKAGTRDLDKLADSAKEAQIRLKAGDITKALGDISAPVAREIEAIVKAGEQGILSTKEVLKQTTRLTEEAFDSKEISESLRTQLQVAVAGTPAEDIGSDVYARVFGADIDTAAIQEKAKIAGQQIVGAIEPQGFFEKVSRGFEVMQTKASEAFAPVLAGAGEVLTTVGQIGPGLALAGQKMADFGGASGVLGKVKDKLGGVGNAAGGLGGSFKGSIGSMLKIAGPLALIGGLVAILVKAYETNEEFRASVDGLFETLQGVGQTILTAIQPAITALLDNLKPVLTSLGEVFGNLVSRLAPVFGRILNVLGGLLSTIVGVAGRFIEALLPAIESIVGVGAILLEVLGNLVGVLVESLAPILETLGTLLGTVGAALGESLGAILLAITPLITLLAEGLSFLIGLLADGLLITVEILAPVLEQLALIIGEILVVAAEILTVVITTLVDVLGAIISVAADVGSAIGGFLVDAFNGTVTVINDVVDAISGFIGWLSDAAGAVLDFVSEIPIIGDVIGGISDAVDFVGDAVGGAIDDIGSFFSGASDSVDRAAQKTKEASKEAAAASAIAFGNATAKMLGFATQAEQAAERLTKKMVTLLGFTGQGGGEQEPDIDLGVASSTPTSSSSSSSSKSDPFKERLAALKEQKETDELLAEQSIRDEDALKIELLKIERDHAKAKLGVAEEFAAKENEDAEKSLNDFSSAVISSTKKLNEARSKLLTDFAKQVESEGKAFLDRQKAFVDYIDEIRADLIGEDVPISLALTGIEEIRAELATAGDEILPEAEKLREALSKIPKEIIDNPDLREARTALADELFGISEEVAERILRVEKEVADGIIDEAQAADAKVVIERDASRRRLVAVETFYAEVEKKRDEDIAAELDAEKAKFSIRGLFVDASKQLVDALASYRDAAREKDLDSEKGKLDDELDELTASLAKREVAFRDYDARVREINERRGELSRELGDSEITFSDRVLSALGQAAESFAGQQSEALRAALDEDLSARDAFRDKEQERRRFHLSTGLSAEEAAQKASEDAEKDHGEQVLAARDNVWAQSIATLGATFAGLRKDGGNLLIDLGVATLDTLQSVVISLGPTIVAQWAATLGPVGAAIAAGLATTLVATGISALKSGLADLEGKRAFQGEVGIRGEGTATSDSNKYWLSVGESVITAKGTDADDNADLFRHINKTGRSWRDYARMQVPSMIDYRPPQPELSNIQITPEGEVANLTGIIEATKEQTTRLESKLDGMHKELKWQRRATTEYRERVQSMAKEGGAGKQLSFLDSLFDA